MHSPKLKTLILNYFSKIWPKKIAPRVIYYHSVSPFQTRSLEPDKFAQQLDWLIEKGFTIVTFSELVRMVIKGKASHRMVAVTFDDGYIDNYEYAFPLLLERQLSATFFIVSALVKGINQPSALGHKLYSARLMMNKYQLREMHQYRMEIASHTRTHIHVRNTLRTSEQRAWEELAISRDELEEIVGDQVMAFAYPNGQKGVFDKKTREMLNRVGYQYAATTIWGAVNLNTHPLEVPRMEIKTTDTLETFERKIEGHFDYLRLYSRTRDRSKAWVN